ncbi:hypothetical protein [Ureibacillus chungkukjangi]|uniref:Uncharacterized protein n=1 Tax=Ureibacillus chungkukjangi TaxID=1202712 RepID=A0A318TQL7_9BACL|nr:hypothetical protein [Ureibacillus chungkukjangi]PYF06090.1 hypothetical protein BJ095_11251 [Ureibacillus chungkukjangi]
MVIAVVLTACGTDETEVQPQTDEQIVEEVEAAEDQGEQGKENEESVEADSSEADPKSLQSAIPSDWEVKLPTDFPVTEGKHLTAITSSEENEVTYEFYETDQELPINDPNVKKSGQLIGNLVITKYETADAAGEEIDQTVFADGEPVDLGHGITGYQDGGAGSLFTSWNEGRWAITARSTTEKSEESLATAKETVEFLETNMLPIPKQYGHLHVDAEDSGSLAKWQKQNIVYTMTDFGDQTLDWLVTFK